MLFGKTLKGSTGKKTEHQKKKNPNKPKHPNKTTQTNKTPKNNRHTHHHPPKKKTESNNNSSLPLSILYALVHIFPSPNLHRKLIKRPRGEFSNQQQPCPVKSAHSLSEGLTLKGQAGIKVTLKCCQDQMKCCHRLGLESSSHGKGSVSTTGTL